MIGELPVALKIGEKSYRIDPDFRTALNICTAFSDPELTDREKAFICLNDLYEDFSAIPKRHAAEALERAYWFIGGGDELGEGSVHRVRILDWQQDERLIFPAVNKAAGYETRAVPYLHWWSFLGLFGEIGEGLFSTVLHIRSKKAKGKRLEKWERDFLSENRKLVEIQRKYTKEEQAERERINALLD